MAASVVNLLNWALFLAGLDVRGPYLPFQRSQSGRRRLRGHAREVCVHMTTFTSVTPNLLVRDIERSASFYREVLGFTVKQSVPDAAPFVFLWMERDGVPVFLNDPKAVEHDVSGATSRPSGGTATMYFVVSGIDALHAKLAACTTVVMPLKTQFYGMREFAVEDPDGHVLTFAERVSE